MSQLPSAELPAVTEHSCEEPIIFEVSVYAPRLQTEGVLRAKFTETGWWPAGPELSDWMSQELIDALPSEDCEWSFGWEDDELEEVQELATRYRKALIEDLWRELYQAANDLGGEYEYDENGVARMTPSLN